MINMVVCEMNNFYQHFQSKLCRKQRPKYSMPHLLFYCQFRVLSNTGLKSKICSDRLQNFRSAKSEQDKSVKWSDSSYDNKNRDATVKRKDALNLVSSHSKVTKENLRNTLHTRSLMAYWQFLFTQHLKNVCTCPKHLFKATDSRFSNSAKEI